jgi:guanine nucleotide-binding protein subunit beta
LETALQFHPSGFAFATASEDFTTRLFDIRSDQEVSQYAAPTPNVGFTSVILSKSGRYLLAGGDEGGIHTWDALKSAYLGKILALSIFQAFESIFIN